MAKATKTIGLQALEKEKPRISLASQGLLLVGAYSKPDMGQAHWVIVSEYLAQEKV